MNRETIERYIQNRCTDAERAEIEQWIEQHGQQWYDDYFESNYESQRAPASEAADETVFRQVLHSVRSIPPVETVVKAEKALHSIQYPIRLFRWAAAACVILLVGAACFGLWRIKDKPADPSGELAWIEVANKDQAARKIVLPDNSQVMLSRGSAIRYPPVFSVKERIVELTGEAFFEVRHDVMKPFVVKAGDASTIVYGTAFNVQAYAGEGHVAIALKRGKIGVSYKRNGQPDAERILAPGQLYQYNKATGQYGVTSIPPEQVGSWVDGALSFYNTPLKDVFIELERKFGVHFIVGSNISAENTFTSYFLNASLEQVLNHLRFTSELQFKKRSNEIYVK